MIIKPNCNYTRQIRNKHFLATVKYSSTISSILGSLSDLVTGFIFYHGGLIMLSLESRNLNLITILMTSIAVKTQH